MLPFGASRISKYDVQALGSLFELYLDVQKQLVMSELPEREVKGRWKSFVARWNRGELAEGWYDPATKTRADQPRESPQADYDDHGPRESPGYTPDPKDPERKDEDSDDASIGPTLPGTRGTGKSVGPTIPTFDDLALHRDAMREQEESSRDELRHARKLDRKEQKEQLDELVPRAAAGTRERQVEKKREVNDKMRAFRKKSPGAMEDVNERELMGGGDEGGIGAHRAKVKAHERKKNERELRKEEMLRTRAAEREVRLREHRAKEEKTMTMFKALAKQNFG